MSGSSLASALEAVGDRWTLLVVDALLSRPMRFGELQDALGDIAPNTLSQRLQNLDREGIVVSRPYQERPPRFAYELTEDGQKLATALHLLNEWGARRAGVDAERHSACGTPIETRLWCPTCARAVHADEPSGVDVL